MCYYKIKKQKKINKCLLRNSIHTKWTSIKQLHTTIHLFCCFALFIAVYKYAENKVMKKGKKKHCDKR